MKTLKLQSLLAFTFIALPTLLSACGRDESANHTETKPSFVYVLNVGDDTISQYQMSDAGSLSPLAAATVKTGEVPTSMTMDLTHQFMYVANMNSTSISQYAIGSDGALNEIGTPVITTNAVFSLMLSSDGKYIFSMNASDQSISTYTIGHTGLLTLTSTVSDLEGPMGMTLSPNGQYAYTANATSTISQYSVLSDGTLSPLSPSAIPTASCPTGPIKSYQASGGGSFVAMLSCSDNAVEIFSIGNDGTLSALQTLTTDSPQGVFISDSKMYIANMTAATVSMFAIQADGTITPVAQSIVPAGSSPETLAINAARSSALVLDYYSDRILQYSLNGAGELVQGSSPIATGSTPAQILLK